jgi:hypothetical protein
MQDIWDQQLGKAPCGGRGLPCKSVWQKLIIKLLLNIKYVLNLKLWSNNKTFDRCVGKIRLAKVETRILGYLLEHSHA